MSRTKPLAPARARGRLAGFAKDRKGVSAIEFAFTMPFLILFFLGVAELGEALTCQRKVSITAFTVGNLVTQQSQISPAQMTDIFSVAGTLIPTQMQGNLTVRVMSVGYIPGGQIGVLWCQVNPSTATLLTCPAPNTALPNFPTGLLATQTSTIIQTDTVNQFTSILQIIIPNGITMTSTSYTNPRQGLPITLTS